MNNSALQKLTNSTNSTQGVEDVVMEAVADMRISCSIPKSSLLSIDSQWKYRAHFDAGGLPTGIESLFDGDSVIDVHAVQEALGNSCAVVENHFPGITFFRDMFAVPMYDDSVNGRKAFAVFINKTTCETVPAIDKASGRILAIADPIRTNSSAAISPIDPDISGEIPIVTAMNPVSVSPMSMKSVENVVDARELNTGILVVSFGTNDVRVIHHDVQMDGAPLLPIDNFGNTYTVSSDLELMFPPNMIFTKDSEYLTLIERTCVSRALTKLLDTGHVGKRILQVMAHYFSGKSSDMDLFQNPSELANAISCSVATALNRMLVGSAHVRQAVIDQMYDRIDTQMFVLDGSENFVHKALLDTPGEISLCVNLNHPFKIGVPNTNNVRNVAVRNLPIIIKLV